MLRRTNALTSIALVIATLGTGAAVAAQRTFVSTSGVDNVACSVAAPCRSFGAAITATTSGGEVIVLDSGGYGVVTITQSVSIIAPPGIYGGISASTGNAITIATGGINVVLRGLSLNGIGATHGVSMTNGNRLSIEGLTIANFSGNGIFVDAAADVRIVDTVVRDNGNYGVQLQGGASGDLVSSKIFGNAFIGVAAEGAVASTKSTVVVTDSTVSGNEFGIVARSLGPATGNTRVSVIRTTVANNATTGVVAVSGSGASAVLTISDSLVASNGCGAIQSGAGSVFETLGTNTLRQNGADTCGGAFTTILGF